MKAGNKNIKRAEMDTSTAELYLTPAAMVTSEEELVMFSAGEDTSTAEVVVSPAAMVTSKGVLVMSSLGEDTSKEEVVMSPAAVVTSEAALVVSSAGEDTSKAEVVTSSAGTGSSFRYRIYHAVNLIIVTKGTCHEAGNPDFLKALSVMIPIHSGFLTHQSVTKLFHYY